MSVWTVVAVAWVAVFAGCVIGWTLRGSRTARSRGGMLDLTPAASRGELDLDWSFPSILLPAQNNARITRYRSPDTRAFVPEGT